jgi:hypothetical protein
VSTYVEQLQRITKKYIAAGETWPATTHQIAAWAIKRTLWSPHPSDLVNQCADQLARAMREEFITDPQGRVVRAKHAARIKRGAEQMTLWADIRTASPEHMAIAFQQRRQQIVGDCRQLKLDVDSYNQNNNPGLGIQMVFDFRNDLAELEAAAAA